MKTRVAAEILAAGICPLSCKYCYIPKDPEMNELHNAILEALKSGSYIQKLKEVFGNDLEHLGFWGTEPALAFDSIIETLRIAQKSFPALKTTGFSTSLIFPAKVYLDFLDKIESLNLKCSVDFQISLDGPSFITDVNRSPGITSKVTANFKALVDGLQSRVYKNISVKLRWKATHSLDNMKLFLEDPSKLEEYESFFNDLEEYFRKNNSNRQIQLVGGHSPSLVVPGKYTKEDGEVFAKYLSLYHAKGKDTTYSARLRNMIVHENEITKNPHSMTCSGGDSNFGLSENLLLCHRFFYYNSPKYIKAILSHPDIENWDVSAFEKGTIDMINKFYSPLPDDEKDKARFFYVLRNYHDFWRFKLAYTKALLTELALVGQASPIYLRSNELSTLFALFMNIALSCPGENLINTGSIHCQVVSLIRLWANGAFEELVRHELSRRK